MKRLLRRCNGSSYSLSAVLTAPFYLFVLCVAFEAAVMGVARLGTQYAAHAAARSAVIWEDDLQPKLAAYGALAPFLGSRQRDPGPVTSDVMQAAQDYQQYYGAQGLDWRFRVAAAKTNITITRPGPGDPKGKVTVTVEFKAPLWIPGVSRFLDPDGQSPYELPMTATVTMPNDAPVTKTGKLGIDYSPGGLK